jgi:organic radical activating enzyme
MSDDELETILSYLDPRVDVVSLLGGEPTLHSKFKEIVSHVSNKGYIIKIFTNGATAPLRGIHGIAPHDIRIILNLNMPDTYNIKEWQQIETNCTLFKDQIALSFNVYKPDFSWQYIQQAILQWGLNRFVRIGMAQPIKGMNNAYLPEKDLRTASSRLVAMAEDLANDGIRLGFDCGFRACTFTKEELGILAECGTQFLFACKPVLDIGPQLMTWRCFPFSVGPGIKLTDFKSLKEVEQYFTEKWASIQKKGNTAECADCMNMLVASCSGGCLSRSFINSSVEM